MTDFDPTRCFAATSGDDGVLISRDDIRTWLFDLATASDRLRVETLGIATEGQPIDAVYIAEDLTEDRLGELRSQRQSVVDALLGGRSIAHWTTPVVLITSGIHATEVGGPQSIPELIHWLVTSEDQLARAIRKRVLTIVVPTLNPGGMDLVQRWNERTADTNRAGTAPPLLYHRFAGHDNNRDWLYQNLIETRLVLDRLHATWLPHVTLDQHQMNANGPRFVLPPYADPWEPHVHSAIIAASSDLGQSIATDLTLAGLPGVATGRYFDAWEPSRAIQHYRGGVRILAEAASANLAHPIEISAEQLAAPPLPQDTAPGTSSPLPWTGGTWRLRDIMDYHVAAARSLLRQVCEDPDRWQAVQMDALGSRAGDGAVAFDIPLHRPAIDTAANRRLAEILDGAGLRRADRSSDGIASFSTDQPLGSLIDAVLLPKPYPERHGSTAYDVTTHFLPLLLGATLRARTGDDRGALATSDPVDGRYLLIDARCHAAPEAIEAALARTERAMWRATARELVCDVLIEPGTWIVGRDAIDRDAISFATGALDSLPASVERVSRRDVVLLNVGDNPTSDHGWTRWWLHTRKIPFLEADMNLADDLLHVAGSSTIVVADTPRVSFDTERIETIRALIDAGANLIAFGAAGRALAGAISSGIESVDFDSGSKVHAPGAVVRLRLDPGESIAMGLDRTMPVMLQRDGVLRVDGGASNVHVLARFAERDTVISGWMSDARVLANSPAIVRIRRGAGVLHAFAFRPLFRAQTLVTAPLVHNLIYSEPEPALCPPSARAKTHVASRSAPTS